MKPPICIDLDGVLARWEGSFDPLEFGSMVPGADQFVKELSKMFVIIIHTSRMANEVAYPYGGQYIKERIKDWLDQNEIPYDQIWGECGKPVGVMYIDDRAHRCRPQEEGPDAYKNAIHQARKIFSDISE